MTLAQNFKALWTLPFQKGTWSQLAVVDPEKVLPLRHKADVAGSLAASLHLIPVRVELVGSRPEVAHAFLQRLTGCELDPRTENHLHVICSACAISPLRVNAMMISEGSVTSCIDIL